MKTENELRAIIREYLNGEMTKEELANMFDLEKCEMCGEYNFSEYLIDTDGMVNGGIGYVCENCKSDMN